MNNVLCELIESISGEESNYDISERNQYLDIKINSKNNLHGQFKKIMAVLSKFPPRDKLEIIFSSLAENELIISEERSVQEKEFDNFFSEISEEEFKIEITIEKEIVEGVLSVYNYEKFCEDFLSLDAIEIIKRIETDFQDRQQLVFEVFDKNVFWATKTIIVRNIDNDYKLEKFDRKERIESCRKNTNFFWIDSNIPIPDDFHIIVKSSSNPFENVFQKIETILSAIYVVDSARLIQNNEKVVCELIGQRMNAYEISISEVKYNQYLYDIYNWAYTEGNIVDKITIIRNLLSMHCRYIGIVNIDEKTFGSIKVNYSLYQKENVEKFIELKNNMIKIISDSVDYTQIIIEKDVANLGKNIIAFLSFILTVFISNVVNEKGIENIFTRDITYLFYAVWGFSICFMAISYIISQNMIKRVEKKYDRIKQSSEFIKGSKEYNEVFDDGQIENIKTETCKCTKKIFILWIIMIIIFLLVIECASQYSISKMVIKKIFIIEKYCRCFLKK